MKLYFYNTEFRPEMNGVFEEIETYLGKLTPTMSMMDFKYIQPRLDTKIKIDSFSHQFTNQYIGNYIKAVDESNNGEIYYYFIMGYKWLAKNTLELSISLDTLNTFWGKISLSDQTHITRKYKDRYIIKKQIQKAVAKVDSTAESISAPPMLLQKKSAVGDANRWYLVYKTEYSTTADLSENPVNCWCIPENAVAVATGNIGNIEWAPGMFGDNVAYAISSSDSAGAKFTIGGNTVTIPNAKVGTIYISTVVYFLYNVSYAKYYAKILTTTYSLGTSTTTFTQYEGDSLIFNTCAKVYKQDWDFANAIVSTNDKTWPREGTISYADPYILNAGEGYSSLIDWQTWYNAHKTESRLIKIQELPYAPFTVDYNEDGTLNIPEGWSIDSGILKLETASRLGGYISTETILSADALDKTDIDVTAAPNEAHETKLINSNYSYNKFIYDTGYYIPKPENATSSVINPTIDIEFDASTSMDSSVAFSFDSPEKLTSDFGDYIVSTRSLEVPYYTNEYLNYLRYGKAYDEKSRAYTVAGSVASGISTSAGLVASFAIGSMSKIAGAVVGAITAAVSLTTSIAKANDSINAKIDQYKSQASQTNSASDVSIFKIYGQNKLLKLYYAPNGDITDSLFNYFRLYGYAADTYGKPADTRYWSDYYVLEPVFESYNVWAEFKDDIAARMKVGYRVYHWHDGYDLNNTKENWETSLVSWSNS